MVRLLSNRLFLLVLCLVPYHDSNAQQTHHVQPRIIGGTKAPPNTYPWFVYSPHCSASLITSQHIITAAHCAFMINEVEVGTLCLEQHDDQGDGDTGTGSGTGTGNDCRKQQYSETFSISETYYHNNFNGISPAYDVAILKLNASSTIQPVVLDHGEFSPAYSIGKALWVSGFGITDGTGQDKSTPNHLMHAPVLYVNQTKCAISYSQDYGNYSAIDVQENIIICAAGFNEQDACLGDSGGPLYDENEKVLVGIVSFGWGCGDANFPGGYTRISSMWPWIHETLCNNSSSDEEQFQLCSQLDPIICDGISMTLILGTDGHPSDTSWWITEKISQTTVEFGEGYKAHQTYTIPMCLKDGCYEFTMFDAFGDGLELPGRYSLTINDEIISEGNMFGRRERISFGSCSLSPSPSVSPPPTFDEVQESITSSGFSMYHHFLSIYYLISLVYFLPT